MFRTLATASLLVAAGVAAAQDAPPSAPPAAPPGAPPAGAPADDAASRAEVDRARALTASGDPSGAIAALRDAEKRLGASAALRLESARAHLALAERELAAGGDPSQVKGLVADAHLRWKQAVAIDASVPGAAVLRARILRFEEDPKGAKEVLRQRLAEEPRDADAWRLLGEMATNAREWEAADDAWTRAAVLDPEDGLARLEATVAKQWLGAQAADLERGYLLACRLLPEDERAIRLLLALHARDAEKRMALLRKVVEENPSAVWARVWIAHLLRQETPARPDEALAVLREAERIAPASSAVHFNLAELLEARGETAGALAQYVLAVESGKPGEVGEASSALDRLLHVSPAGKSVPLTTRVRAYDALCAKNPETGAYGNNAGFWFRDVGRDYRRSLRYYELSVAAEPDEQDFLNDTGLIHLFHLTESKDACLPYFEKVLRLVEEEGAAPRRGYWDALENLCKYWFERGDHRKVIACATKRADPAATLDGRPYPSRLAASYKARSEKALRGGG